jgi:hypothetical protein
MNNTPRLSVPRYVRNEEANITPLAEAERSAPAEIEHFEEKRGSAGPFGRRNLGGARRSREWSVGARIAGRPYLRVIHIAALCAGAAPIEWGKEPTISVSTARAGRSSHTCILLGA